MKSPLRGVLKKDLCIILPDNASINPIVPSSSRKVANCLSNDGAERIG